ncbi:thioesterase [Natronosporangium hydrolyticum]|uniref:Thioesterase n=1 Tax=Natronosporangium hydrolyticum TaxID=2811111 RepID=A0A895YGT5_9ACTN|nr:alpha/beta fold hydrolase [Natronosporangium hydrolyticum]QSB16771.1 thioesterase [Natronosporangium hydrolyticum]
MVNRSLPAPPSWFDGLDPPGQPGPRLFCLPHAGGGGRFFQPWRRALAPKIAVRPVVPPGREGRFREPPYERMAPLVAGIVEALRPELDRPFALFGHSLGAAVAYETALRLRQLSMPEPICLFVSGRRAPALPNPPPYLHLLDDQQFAQEMVRLAGTPPTILERPRVMQFLVPTMRADYTIHELYQPTPAKPLDYPVFGYAGAEDPIAPPAEVDAWHEVTTGQFTTRVFPGGHFYLKEHPDQVLANVQQDLADALP